MWTRFLTNGCPNFHDNICGNILCTRSIHRMRIFTHPAYRYWDVQYIVHCVCACAVPVHIQNIKTCALPAVSLAVYTIHYLCNVCCTVKGAMLPLSVSSSTCVMCAVLWRVQCCRSAEPPAIQQYSRAAAPGQTARAAGQGQSCHQSLPTESISSSISA